MRIKRRPDCQGKKVMGLFYFKKLKAGEKRMKKKSL